MGMLIFVFTELMLFAGFISAFTIIKSGAVAWPPPGQPRLPFEETAFNTALLPASAVMLIWTRRTFTREEVPDLEAELSAAIASINEGDFRPTPSQFACAGCPALDVVCAGPGLPGAQSVVVSASAT